MATPTVRVVKAARTLFTSAAIGCGNSSGDYDVTVKALNSLQANTMAVRDADSRRKRAEEAASRGSAAPDAPVVPGTSSCPSTSVVGRSPELEEILAATSKDASRCNLEPKILPYKVIHVTGTKGKGSTCVMVDSILGCMGVHTGLFTSPHMVDVRERIRIDGKPVGKPQFIASFWNVWDHLELSDPTTDPRTIPGYFKFLTLVALDVFKAEEVDCAIFEVGLGGRYDATNIVQPVAAGVTSLGLDHTSVLGNTIQDIAFQKGGIYKKCAGVSYSVPQPQEALAVLKECAQEVGSTFVELPKLELSAWQEARRKWSQRNPETARDLPMPPSKSGLGISADCQLINAGLAVRLAAKYFTESSVGPAVLDCHTTPTDIAPTSQLAPIAADGIPLPMGAIPTPFVEGLLRVRWPGRAQVVEFSNVVEGAVRIPPKIVKAATPLSNSPINTPPQTPCSEPAELPYYLKMFMDGAHTVESMEQCREWFSGARDTESDSMVWFACQTNRDPLPLTGCLFDDSIHFSEPAMVTTLQMEDPNEASVSYSHRLNTSDHSSGSRAGVTVVADPHSLKVMEALEKADGLPSSPEFKATLDSGLRACIIKAQEAYPKTLEVLVTGSLYLVGGVLNVSEQPATARV